MQLDDLNKKNIKQTKAGWWFGAGFPYIGNVIIPTDELIFFRGVGIPPTSIYYTI
jgi:hypothetical protein